MTSATSSQTSDPDPSAASDVPAPAAEALRFGEAYFDRQVAERYGTQHRRLGRRISHAREEWIIGRLLGRAPHPGAWVLDAPCGSGRFTQVLTRLGWRVLALDRALPMVEQAVAARPRGVVAGSLAELPLNTKCLEGALCARFLHHLASPSDRLRILSEIRRVTRGPLVVSLWLDSFVARFRRERRRRASTRWFTTEAEARALFAEAGLRPVARIRHAPFWAALAYYRLEPL